MSVRFSNTGQHFSGTTGVPGTALFTVTCWMYISVDRNAATLYWLLDSSGTQYMAVGTLSDGVTLVFDWATGGISQIDGSAMTVGAWYRVAVSVNGTTAKLYQGTATQADLTLYTGGTFNLPTGTLVLHLGGSPNYSTYWPNGRLAAFKMWDAELTKAEIEREFRTYLPQRRAGLNRWYPMVNTDLSDYSGNARTLSGGAGATTEHGPPIPWANYTTSLIPWDPSTDVWYAHYDSASGELLSLGTVLPDPVPAGTALLAVLGRPNQAEFEWSTTARTFVRREGIDPVDRVADLISDAALTSVWSTLDTTQDAALQARIAALLGPYRYRTADQSVNLE